VETFDANGRGLRFQGTPRFRRTPVEKHCCM